MKEHRQDFEEVIGDLIPRTEEEFTVKYRQRLQELGSSYGNDSEKSPFFHLLSALIYKPLKALREFLLDSVLPNIFLKTASGNFLTLIAWAYTLERLPPSKAQGKLLFSREGTTGDIPIAAGSIIATPPIGEEETVYRVIVAEDTILVDGEQSVCVPVIAENEGSAYNLGANYYTIPEQAISGITAITNQADWLTVPGRNMETDGDLRERCRSEWQKRANWHTDAAYRSLIAEFAKIGPDNIYFDKYPTRQDAGITSADALIMLDVGLPSAELIASIDDFINLSGNHGHGDDLKAVAMPLLSVWCEVTVTLDANTTAAEKRAVRSGIQDLIRAIFRENMAYPDVKRVKPWDTYPLSDIIVAIDRHFLQCKSIGINLPTGDIVSKMHLPRLATLPTIHMAV